MCSDNLVQKLNQWLVVKMCNQEVTNIIVRQKLYKTYQF